MYTSRFASDNGTFYFGYESGTIFDISPLGSLDVEISTSQGYFQVGTTVEAETVSGVSREIKGVFIDYTDTALAEEMISIFAPGVHGKLYFNDDVYCDATVQKTPDIILADRKRTFSLMLYCEYPYWITVDESIHMLGGYDAAFEFPVCYDTHTFGVKNSDVYTNCFNAGSVERPFSVVFTCNAAVTNYGIKNIYTDEYLQFDDTLSSDEELDVYWDGSILKIEKTVDGVTSNAFSLLDEGSTLFSLSAGDNYIKQYAEEEEDNLIVVMTHEPAVVGVLAE